MTGNANVQRWLAERFVPAADPFIQALDRMAYGYLIGLLWSTNDESTPSGGNPLDETFSPEDMTDEFWLQTRQDVWKFVEAEKEGYWRVDPNRAGIDLWLTRAGHGAGFWDGDWDRMCGEGVGDYLTKIVNDTFESVDVYVGDDGELYFG